MATRRGSPPPVVTVVAPAGLAVPVPDEVPAEVVAPGAPVRGRYVQVLAAGVRLAPGKLARQVACLDARPELAAVCGDVRRPDGTVDGVERFGSLEADAVAALWTRLWPAASALVRSGHHAGVPDPLLWLAAAGARIARVDGAEVVVERGAPYGARPDEVRRRFRVEHPEVAAAADALVLDRLERLGQRLAWETAVAEQGIAGGERHLADVRAEIARLGPAAAAPARRWWRRGRRQRELPRVAVVVPCRDVVTWLDEALDSAHALEAVEVELVVVDDGSTNPDALAAFARLRAAGTVVLRTDGVGIGAARNLGIAATTAPWVLPLDADNRVRPRYACDAIAVLAEDPRAGACYGDVHRFGEAHPAVLGDHAIGPVGAADFVLENPVDACAVVRRAALDAVGGYLETREYGWEDWDLWLSLLDAGWELRPLGTVGFDYRVHPCSTLRQAAGEDRLAAAYDRLLERHPAVFAAHLPRVLAREQLARHGSIPRRWDEQRVSEDVHALVARQHREVERLNALVRELGGA